MTLEAWVNPDATTSKWRDVIYKGNDNYYLEATVEQREQAGRWRDVRRERTPTRTAPPH